MARKKTGRNAKSFSEAVGFRNKYHSDTTDFFLGLFLLALTVYVLIAMVSYLSTRPKHAGANAPWRNHEFKPRIYKLLWLDRCASLLLSYHAELWYSCVPYPVLYHTGCTKADESLFSKLAEMVLWLSTCHGLDVYYLC